MSTAVFSPPPERIVTNRIYAIRYAHLDRTSDKNFLGGDDHAHPMPIDYYVWVINGESRTIVVDTGFDSAAAVSRDAR